MHECCVILRSIIKIENLLQNFKSTVKMMYVDIQQECQRIQGKIQTKFKIHVKLCNFKRNSGKCLTSNFVSKMKKPNYNNNINRPMIN